MANKTAKLSAQELILVKVQKIPDPFGLFAGMTERDFVDFIYQYITDEGKI